MQFRKNALEVWNFAPLISLYGHVHILFIIVDPFHMACFMGSDSFKLLVSSYVIYYLILYLLHFWGVPSEYGQ
jgi:hypothetical protein